MTFPTAFYCKDLIYLLPFCNKMDAKLEIHARERRYSIDVRLGYYAIAAERTIVKSDRKSTKLIM